MAKKRRPLRPKEQGLACHEKSTTPVLRSRLPAHDVFSTRDKNLYARSGSAFDKVPIDLLAFLGLTCCPSFLRQASMRPRQGCGVCHYKANSSRVAANDRQTHPGAV